MAMLKLRKRRQKQMALIAILPVPLIQAVTFAMRTVCHIPSSIDGSVLLSWFSSNG